MFCLVAALVGKASGLSLLHYNVAGNGTTNWGTNSLQIQAIGRQMLYWQPEVVTFNEIPRTNTWQMASFVSAYLPGYFLAVTALTENHAGQLTLLRWSQLTGAPAATGAALADAA